MRCQNAPDRIEAPPDAVAVDLFKRGSPLLDSISNASRYWGFVLQDSLTRVTNGWHRRRDRAAAAFYNDLVSRGFDANSHIDVVPRHRLIYVCIPKCASSTVKMTLSRLSERNSVTMEQLHKRRYSGIKSPAQTGLTTFHRLATDPATLRFSFVRNPYARVVSAWADKYQSKPLVPGDAFVDQFLAYQRSVDPAFTPDAGRTLSFGEFVEFAAVTADKRVNAHWHMQDDLLNMPGIALDFIGKVESFNDDFRRVLDHVGASEQLRQSSKLQINPSQHNPWAQYYTSALADRIYRAYERDFDRLKYARSLD